MHRLAIVIACTVLSNSTLAANLGKTLKGAVTTPTAGVICDKKAGFCADSTGISMALTKMYLGDKAEQKLISYGDMDMTDYTLSNRVRCISKEQKCTVTKFDSKVDAAHTKALFGK